MVNAVAISFYTAEELSVAKIRLQKAAESVGLMVCVGLRNVLEQIRQNQNVVTILQFVNEQKLLDLLPVLIVCLLHLYGHGYFRKEAADAGTTSK